MKEMWQPVLISGFGTIGAVGTAPRFICHFALANHTHLASYTRVVSLPRVALAPAIRASACAFTTSQF